MGRTGSGKTTLVNLMMRIFDPGEGMLYIGGREIHTIPLKDLRQACGYVPQDNFLFSDTISANIAFGDRSKTQAQIEEAAKAACVHDNIVDFADGYDTLVGERGVSLSGGQKQRIAIARALILDPEILSYLIAHGFYINQCYSMTELAGYGLLNVTQEGDHLRALGKPDGFCEVKVDKTGEICVRGGCVMLGYYKDPEATAETIDKDGWLHTGDLARVDEEGYYYMTGRKKNLIILDSGENVSPEELEKLLGKCDAIKECIVKEMGKKIGTVVCCEEENQQQVKEFVTELNRSLPLYKRISVVECSAEPLPRNALGKLLRK